MNWIFDNTMAESADQILLLAAVCGEVVSIASRMVQMYDSNSTKTVAEITRR